MQRFLAAALNVAYAVCAVAMVGLLALKQFGPTRTGTGDPTTGLETTEQPVWNGPRDAGHRVGSVSARAVMVVFTDYQCPACAMFERQIAPVQDKFGDNLAVIYRPFPLDRPHPHAFAAAVAVECAAVQGSFEALHRTLFAAQRTIGLAPWEEFAKQAGVADLAGFTECMQNPATEDGVREQVRHAVDAGIRATPTVWLNGVQFKGTAPRSALDSLVEAALKR